MKVLEINVNAVAGSTGKIVTDVKHSLDREGHQILIAYGANQTVNKQDYFRLCSNNERKVNSAMAKITGVYYGCFTPFSFYRLRKIIETEKPDVVHIHCANGFILNLFRTLDYLAKNNIKTVVTNHAEFFYTGGCGHAFECDQWLSGCSGKCNHIKKILPFGKPAKYMWHRFKKTFDKFDRSNIVVTSVSPWVMSRASRSPLLSRLRHTTVLNGLDTSIFHPTLPNEQVSGRLPKGKPILLHVSAQFTTDSTNKGGEWICKIASMMPDINIVVAASSIGNLENLPPNIMIWGRTKDQKELAMLYTIADLTIITSKRETFSMVTAESLCCGTPVVGFKAGGPESIALSKYSRFVTHGDVESLRDAVEEMMSQHFNRNEISAEASAVYSKERMAADYLQVYRELTGK